MVIYLINIMLLFVWKKLFLERYSNGRKIFCCLASAQWFVLSAFRHPDIGSDTWFYGSLFNSVSSKTWTEIWQESIGVLSGVVEGRDMGYSFVVKMVSCIYNDYRFLLILVAGLLAYTLGKFIYENSEEPFFSYLLFSCLFYEFYAITGIRQTIATCLVVFWGIKYIKQRDFWRFCILTLLASTIHKSCWVMFLLYFLADKIITMGYLVIVCLAGILCFVFRNNVFLFLSETSGYTDYEIVEGAGTTTFTFLLIGIFFLVMISYQKLIKINQSSVIYVNALVFAVLFVPLTFVEPNTMRVVQYFSVFLMLLLPTCLKCFGRMNGLVRLVGELLLLLLFILKEPVYYFM